MTYIEMEDAIHNIPMFGEAGGLDNLKMYLTRLNHPEKDLRVIHVAGTNGKGSVCAFTESILRRAGYKTALFTSPHLISMKERFRINNEECTEEQMIKAWENINRLLEHREEYGLKMLTYFEIMFLMGVQIFSWERPDYCIMETGLGGRLDATVLTNPVLCIITSISLDHVALLGDTIPEIAREKAGIIKKGVPVVYFDEENGASEEIIKKAEEKQAEVLPVSYKDITFYKILVNTIDFSIENRYYKFNHVQIQTRAQYQMYNAAIAIAAIHALDCDISQEVIFEGVRQMRWPGRMEQIAPHIYVDGAHNPGAIRRVCDMMKEEQGSWSLMFAVCADKDYDSMVKMLADIPWKRIYITKMDTTRAASAGFVRESFERYTTLPIDIYDTAEDAFLYARKQMHTGESLLCIGSLYLVGELKKMMNTHPIPE